MPKTLIERSKGKLKMVVQRDERATLLNVPDLSDSIHSAGASERTVSVVLFLETLKVICCLKWESDVFKLMLKSTIV